MYTVNPIKSATALEFIRKWHHVHNSHNRPSPTHGLFVKDILIGVCAYATPCSEQARESVFGEEYKDSVIEMHRVAFRDADVNPGVVAWFIAMSTHLLSLDHPNKIAVIAFVDPTEVKLMRALRILGWRYYGMSEPNIYYIDQEGRLRNRRSNGVRITPEQAMEMGWAPVLRPGRHRYVYFCVDPSRLREVEQMCRLKFLPHPEI